VVLALMYGSGTSVLTVKSLQSTQSAEVNFLKPWRVCTRIDEVSNRDTPNKVTIGNMKIGKKKKKKTLRCN
jgi:hypothetical protein